MLPVLVTIPGHARKMVVIGMYIPPNYTIPWGKKCLDYVSDVVMEVKRRYREPYVVVVGDFNRWGIGEVLEDFADVSEVEVGPTRQGRSIDRIFVNFGRSVAECGTLELLEDDAENGEERRRSDHRVAYITCKLKRYESFKIAERKKNYLEGQKDTLLAEETDRNFFKDVRTYGCAEKPEVFDV